MNQHHRFPLPDITALRAHLRVQRLTLGQSLEQSASRSGANRNAFFLIENQNVQDPCMSAYVLQAYLRAGFEIPLILLPPELLPTIHEFYHPRLRGDDRKFRPTVTPKPEPRPNRSLAICPAYPDGKLPRDGWDLNVVCAHTRQCYHSRCRFRANAARRYPARALTSTAQERR